MGRDGVHLLLLQHPVIASFPWERIHVGNGQKDSSCWHPEKAVLALHGCTQNICREAQAAIPGELQASIVLPSKPSGIINSLIGLSIEQMRLTVIKL